MSTTMTPAMRRSVLIALLRDKSQWPEDFYWDFGDCRTCALGLAGRMLGVELETMGKIDVAFHTAKPFFRWGTKYAHLQAHQITPEMVADCLEAEHQRLVSAGR